MSFEITTAMVKQYAGNVSLLSQQKGSRLRGAVRYEPIVGKEAYFDQIGATTARKRTARHADTPLISTPHSRRRVVPYDYDWADLMDPLDGKKVLISPEGKYAVNAGFAMGRAMDDEIISAFSGTAYTGVDGGTATSFDSNNQIAHGSAGLTITKLLEAKEILDAGDIDPDIPRFIALPASEVTTLLNTAEVKSADYNTVKALAQGELDTFCGFKFIQIERLAVASSVRTCLAWAQDGMLLGVGADIKTDIGPRRDKNMAVQVYVNMSIGATRMEEAKCVEIACWEG